MSEEIKNIVSKNLKSAREAMGLTQQQVAEIMQTKQTVYSRYETGRAELDYYKIEKLCRLFDITPNDLFGF
ncbi:MAG: helix-turn-helix domain-containing protein [Clostridia bacterium]|nr:helix-turn-helix domain-containing protein [Clostridia bacterium]